MKRFRRLSDAVRAEGYLFKVMKHPARVKGGLGTGSSHMKARAYKARDGRIGIACKADRWLYAYSASHEIAEWIHEHKHTAMMFCEQANILSLWHTGRSLLGLGTKVKYPKSVIQ